MVVAGQHHAPVALPPGQRPGTHLQEAGWAALLVWTGAESLVPPEIDPRSVQPVASRCTD